MATTAVELTAAQLRVDRCWIAMLIPDEDRAVVGHDHRRPDLRPMQGEYRYSDFPETARKIEAGTVALDDIQSDSSLTDADKSGFASLRIGAQLAVCLRKGEGRVMWSLTVADEAPRRGTREEATVLEEAAERIWASIERARAEAAMRNHQSRLRLASEAAGLSVFEWDPRRDETAWENDRMFAIFGRSREQGPLTAATFLRDVLHPDDAGPFRQALAQSLTTGRFEYVGRIRRGDGAQRWVSFIGKLEYDAEGRPLRMPGIAADVTQRHEAAEALLASRSALSHRG